ncbi:MAG: sugar ABC transporter permease [Lachnospiraceae bacterium]|nr:sugar ABC transporter permease [Lachnospiraceae bacterium]
MRLNRKEERTAWLFVLPIMLLLICFLFAPLAASLVISFMRWNVLTAPTFTGLNNFKEIFTDPVFYKSLGNTFYLMIGVPIGMVFSFMAAVALNRKMPMSTLFKVILYLPAVTNGIAMAIAWRWIFNVEYGPINQFLEWIGLTDLPNWLNDEHYIKPAYIIMGIWGGLGNTMLFYLASLKSIDQTYYEAAKLDGANGFQCVRHITVPLVSPITFYILICGVIGGLQMFGSVYVMTPGGGINRSAYTIVYYIWDKGMADQRMGVACAAAWVLGILTIIITMVQFKVRDKWVKEVQ